jgi:DNA-binding transcriptional ArsR family regulator
MASAAAADEPLAIHRALAEESRLRILALLREHPPPLAVSGIARSVALHPNTVRDHLSVLLAAGLVRTHRDEQPATGRPRALYEADERRERLFVPLEFERLSEAESLARSRAFLELMLQRRSVREFARRGASASAERTRSTTACANPSPPPSNFCLLASLQAAGLASLVYAPSPMTFLSGILGRPDYERPFLLVAVGYPAGTRVPALPRKAFSEIVDFV